MLQLAVVIALASGIALATSTPSPPPPNVSVNDCSFSFNDCSSLYELSVGDNNIYIVGSAASATAVFCYNNDISEGGGWTVILRQNDISLNDNELWEPDNASNGFGNLRNSHWLGLNDVSTLTSGRDMTLVVRAREDQPDGSRWRVGLFRNFNITASSAIRGGTLSRDIEYVDGNIGHFGRRWQTNAKFPFSRLPKACAGYWWLSEDCEVAPAHYQWVELSIRPTSYDTENACPPFYPFPANTSHGLQVNYTGPQWRAEGGTIEVTCLNPDHVLIWHQQQRDAMSSGEPLSQEVSSQTFTCTVTRPGIYSWSPSDKLAEDGPICIRKCDAGYASNLDPAHTKCVKFFETTSEASDLRQATDFCGQQDASVANPFSDLGTLAAFHKVVGNHTVITGVDLRSSSVRSPDAVDRQLFPPNMPLNTVNCVVADDGYFIDQPCFPATAVTRDGVVCQKPRSCPPQFILDYDWGCIKHITVQGDVTTPEDANELCAEQGSSLPVMDSTVTTAYIQNAVITGINKRRDGVTWRNVDGGEVQVSLASDPEPGADCLLWQPDLPTKQRTAINCIQAMPAVNTVTCIYPRRTGCWMASLWITVDQVEPDETTLHKEVIERCPSLLMFRSSNSTEINVQCHGALGDWLPTDLGDCISVCGPPPPPTTTMTLVTPVADNQTDYTYRCHDGLQNDQGNRESTIVCTNATIYDPAQPSPCNECSGTPTIPENLVDTVNDVLVRTVNSSFVVTCPANMSTADDTNQTVTCAPTGWQPVGLQPCDVCPNPPEVTNESLIEVTQSPGRGIGGVMLYSCPPGKAFSSGENITSAICLPEGWHYCNALFECPLCVEEPPAALDNMERHWNTSDRTANYTCSDQLTLDGNNTVQGLECQTVGWLDDLRPCNKCAQPNETVDGFNVSWTGIELGQVLLYTCPTSRLHAQLNSIQQFPCTTAGWNNELPLPCDRCVAPDLGSWVHAVPENTSAGLPDGHQLVFHCTDGLLTDDQKDTFIETCDLAGWTVTGNCTKCAGDPPSIGRAISRDWNGSRELGAVAVYICTSKQSPVVECVSNGWSNTTDPCNILPHYCPRPPTSSQNNTVLTDTGEDTGAHRNVSYTCQNGIVTNIYCSNGSWTPAHTEPCIVLANAACPDPPAAPEGATLVDSGVFVIDQRNATYKCENGVTTVLFCESGNWTANIELCEPGISAAPPPAPPGVTIVDTGPVDTVDGQQERNCTYDCGGFTDTLQWLDGGWRPENVMPCANRQNACPARNTTANATLDDSGPYTDGVRSAIYTCSNGVKSTFRCVSAAWVPDDIAPCEVGPVCVGRELVLAVRP